MRFACMDVGEGREQDAEAPYLILQHLFRVDGSSDVHNNKSASIR